MQRCVKHAPIGLVQHATPMPMVPETASTHVLSCLNPPQSLSEDDVECHCTWICQICSADSKQVSACHQDIVCVWCRLLALCTLEQTTALWQSSSQHRHRPTALRSMLTGCQLPATPPSSSCCAPTHPQPMWQLVAGSPRPSFVLLHQALLLLANELGRGDPSSCVISFEHYCCWQICPAVLSPMHKEDRAPE